MTDNTLIDSILDSTLEDLADAPVSKPFPAGAHRAIFNFEAKTINNKPAVIIKLKAIETVESSDPEGAVVTDGQEADVMFMFRNNDGSKNEISEGKFKAIVAALKETFPGATNGDTLIAARGAEVLVVTKIRVNKSSGQENTDIVSLQVM
jgi:hypothetical protein